MQNTQLEVRRLVHPTIFLLATMTATIICHALLLVIPYSMGPTRAKYKTGWFSLLEPFQLEATCSSFNTISISSRIPGNAQDRQTAFLVFERQ